jgi:hypothetical protein
MSIRDIIELAAGQPITIAAALAAPPVLALFWSLLHGRDKAGTTPWKQGYAVLVYLSCIPGMLAAVLVGYSLFFSHENLLDQNALVYFLPLVCMIATLAITRRRTAFGDLPGVGRLWAFIFLLGLSFAAAIAIDRTRIFMGFFGSVDRLFLLVAAVFVLLKALSWAAFGRRAKD